jgi:hypothetical protein
MLFSEKGIDLIYDANKEFIYKKEMFGIVCYVENKRIEILVPGIFTVKKRKVLSVDSAKNIYKITIEELRDDFSYLGVSEVLKNITNIYPIVRSQGVLFGKISKKILVNKKRNKVEFTIDSSGKIL